MDVKTLLRSVILLFWFFAGPLNTFAQQFPVQVTPVLTPPYSLYLSDYTSADANLQLIIQLRELDRPQYRIKLRLSIEGQGITIRTKPSYVPQPIVLQGGITEMLSGADIKNYFNPDNLDFIGISKTDFIRAGALPEGYYSFKFEAVDYVRNVVVSNAGFANAWLILNDPPIVNLPFNNDKVAATDPQNISFSWTPRHTASPNAAFTTEYEFILVELYPDNRNPNDAIRAAKPIFVTETSLTSLNYSVTEPLLIPGRKYAFRIRAFDTERRDLFKNNGYSEVFVFQFGDACIPPAGIKAEALDEARIKLTWDQSDLHTAFAIQYRKKGSSSWNDQSVLTNSAVVPGLLANTAYEYQVRGACGSIQGQYSNIAEVKTLESDPNEFACGAPAPAIEIRTTPLQKDLQIDDLIKTADFDISITEIEANGDGSYKGKGKAFLPWFNFASVQVKFTDIKVNEDYRVYSGNVTTVYTKSSRFIANIDASGDDEEKSNDKEEGEDSNPENEIVLDTITFAGDIKEIKVDVSNPDVIVIVAENGVVTEVPREKESDGKTYKEAIVTDSKGDSYIVGKDGTVKQGPSTSAPEALASLDQVNYDVKFKPSPDQVYGFDAKDSALGQYETVTVKGNEYTVPWKSVETGRLEKVIAIAGDENPFPAAVGFTSGGAQIPSQASTSPSEKQIFITGKVDGQEEPVSAYVLVKESDDAEAKQVELGRINVKTYDKISRKLVIVPVNNNPEVPDASALEEQLNKIYGQAVVEWSVEIAQNFEYETEELKGLDSEESDFLSSFPEKMQVLNRTYKNSIFMDNNSYYVFLIEGSESKRSGFMPFKKQFGYIFTDNADDIIKTIAHELGHGAFRLRHTFSPEAFYASQGTTNNLMDYSNGTNLKKYQWDLVHDPENINGWLEGDMEFASEGDVTARCIPAALTKIQTQEYYYNLDKKIILLNSKYEPYAFVDAEDKDHNPGTLAIIRTTGENPIYYYPTESHNYFSFTNDGKIDKRFTEFIENPSAAPTVVLVDKDCNYTIKRPGMVDAKDKLSSCRCFGTKSGEDTGGQLASKIIDLTNENIDVSEIKELFEGKKFYDDPKLGKLQTSIAYLYLTSENRKEGIAEAQNAAVTPGVVKIWLHKNTYGVWIIKEGPNLNKLNEVYASKLRSNFTFDLNKELQAQNSTFTQIATAAYKISDWLSGKVGALLIPEAWWNCDSPNFNPPWYVNIVKKILSPTALIIDQYVSLAIPEGRLKTELSKMSFEDLNFALSVGLWDGLVGLIDALPQTISLATMSFAADDKARSQTEKFAKLIDDNGGGVIGTIKMVFNGIIDQFDYRKPCILAHSVGSLAFDVIVAIFTAGSGAAASKLGNIAKTMLTTLDKLDVLGNAIGGIGAAGLKVAFRGGAKVLTFTVRGGMNLIEAASEGATYTIKIVKAVNEGFSEIDWTNMQLVRTVQMQMPDGSVYNLPMFMDPGRELSNAIVKVKKILKDDANVEIRSDKGEVVAEVEVDGKSELAVYQEAKAPKTEIELDEAISKGLRKGDPSLSRALEEAGFPKAAQAVRNSGKVHENNIRNLDEAGDPGITNIERAYTFNRSGSQFSKKSDQSWEDYFHDLSKTIDLNGGKYRNFNGFESHHIFPIDLFKRKSFRKWYELVGYKYYDINGDVSLENLIMLESKRTGKVGTDGVTPYAGGVHTNHEAYTKAIGDYFDSRWDVYKKQGLEDMDIAELVNDDVIYFSEQLKKSLVEKCVKGSVEVNNLWTVINITSLTR